MYGAITSETPKCELVSKRPDYEVRRYRKQFWAQCTYDMPLNTDYSSVMNYGFSPLFPRLKGGSYEIK